MGGSMSYCFIYMIFLIIQAITNMIYAKGDSSYNFGTKFADFPRHIMLLKSRFRIWFGEPFVFMHREAILSVGGRRR